MCPVVRGTSSSPRASTTDDWIVTRAASDGTYGASAPPSKSLAKHSSLPGAVGCAVRDGVLVDDGDCVPVSEVVGVLDVDAVAVSLWLMERVALGVLVDDPVWLGESVPVRDGVAVPVVVGVRVPVADTEPVELADAVPVWVLVAVPVPVWELVAVPVPVWELVAVSDWVPVPV